jgi:protein-disulfide isomerase
VVGDLPLAFHANARKAGKSAHCANEQGKFWELRDTMLRSENRGQNTVSANIAVQILVH